MLHDDALKKPRIQHSRVSQHNIDVTVLCHIYPIQSTLFVDSALALQKQDRADITLVQNADINSKLEQL